MIFDQHLAFPEKPLIGVVSFVKGSQIAAPARCPNLQNCFQNIEGFGTTPAASSMVTQRGLYMWWGRPSSSSEIIATRNIQQRCVS